MSEILVAKEITKIYGIGTKAILLKHYMVSL